MLSQIPILTELGREGVSLSFACLSDFQLTHPAGSSNEWTELAFEQLYVFSSKPYKNFNYFICLMII